MPEEELKIAKKIVELDPGNEDAKQLVRQIESGVTSLDEVSLDDDKIR